MKEGLRFGKVLLLTAIAVVSCVATVVACTARPLNLTAGLLGSFPSRFPFRYNSPLCEASSGRRHLGNKPGLLLESAGWI